MNAPTPGRSGFAARLLAAQAMVLVAGAITTWVVATFVGPALFRDHLHRAGVSRSMAETGHVEEAFGSALLISISVALVAATITALAVTWYFTRRVQRSILQVATAASKVAAGQIRRSGRRPRPRHGVRDPREQLQLPRPPTGGRRDDAATDDGRPRARDAYAAGDRRRAPGGRRGRRAGARREHPERDPTQHQSTAPARRGHRLGLAGRGGHPDRRPRARPAASVAQAAAEAARDRFVSEGVRLSTELRSNGRGCYDAEWAWPTTGDGRATTTRRPRAGDGRAAGGRTGGQGGSEGDPREPATGTRRHGSPDRPETPRQPGHGPAATPRGPPAARAAPERTPTPTGAATTRGGAGRGGRAATRRTRRRGPRRGGGAERCKALGRPSDLRPLSQASVCPAAGGPAHRRRLLWRRRSVAGGGCASASAGA